MSSSRGQLLDAAAVVMATEGYAAVTSRRVAAEAGLNRALAHYYFHTMDDLFIALLRHQAEQGLATQAKVLKSDQPLWALWDLYRISPAVAAALLESVTRFLAAEATLDMFDGHAETVAFVERLIRRLEGDRHP
jgi:AcrR family transcriptional regulator